MGRTILVAEDDSTIQTVLRVGLERQGYRILVAGDGLAALNLARQEHPDLLVLDVMMPRLSGFEVARLLRFDRAFEKLPILMLTARKEESDRTTGFQTGADAYVTKPFTMDELLPVVRNLLARASGTVEGEGHEVAKGS